ncbi:MAG TPA: cbb3-type cytochrome c oxidase subunit I, partial [Solirubrobacterales bacterium]|nr:cbb3-type cytochrome c oxidase subunit I [Solirubrobacterales bacterium]
MSRRKYRPEIALDPSAEPRPRWIELATSADHKDIGRILIGSSLGFLFLSGLLLVLIRLQLLIPENGFLDPVTFNRLLSVYGETAIFCFALPLIMGLFHYLVPLQIGARSTALPRLSQIGLWLYLAGTVVLYAGFLYTPSEAGINPLPPLSEAGFLDNNGIEIWLSSAGLITLGLILLAIDLITTLRTRRAPGMVWRRMPVFSWAAGSVAWLILVTGSILLAAITMLMLDRNSGGVFFQGDAGGAPLLWQHLTWIFFAGAYTAILVAALGAIAEIVPTLSRRRLQGRPVVIGSLVAIAVLGPLAWLQNMVSAPISSGWLYFGMTMALLMIVPFGLILFNLLATLHGGAIVARSPILFAAGAISMISIGLVAELTHSLVAVGQLLHHTTDATGATHYALVGGAVLGGFAALHYWYPKMTGRVLGESMGRISFWLIFVGANVAFFPLFLAGIRGQVVDAYKYFEGTGLAGYNLVAGLGTLVLFAGVILGLANLIASRTGGRPARHDQWG